MEQSSSSIELMGVPVEVPTHVGPTASSPETTVRGARPPGRTMARLVQEVRRDSRSLLQLISLIRSSAPGCHASQDHAIALARARVQRLRRRLRMLDLLGVDMDHRHRWLMVREAELEGLADNASR